MTNYGIFSSLDMPSMQSILVQTHEPSGSYCGKTPIGGPATAITNALYDARWLLDSDPLHHRRW